jgi:hypothetical protein
MSLEIGDVFTGKNYAGDVYSTGVVENFVQVVLEEITVIYISHAEYIQITRSDVFWYI